MIRNDFSDWIGRFSSSGHLTLVKLPPVPPLSLLSTKILYLSFALHILPFAISEFGTTREPKIVLNAFVVTNSL